MKFAQLVIGTRTYINSATTGWLVLQGEVKEPGDEVQAVAAIPPDIGGAAMATVNYDIVDKTFNTCTLKALPETKEIRLYPPGLYTLLAKESAGNIQIGDLILIGQGSTVAINLNRASHVTGGSWLCALQPVKGSWAVTGDGSSLSMESR